MTKLKYLPIIFLLTLTINSQTWHSFSSMTENIALSGQDSIIWSATSGGLFYYDVTDGSIGTVKQSDGLSGSSLTSLVVDENGSVWVGTQEGNDEGMVNVYIPSSGSVKEISSIMNSNYSQKTINALAAKGDTVFVSTGFGLSLIDINNYTFYDTYVKFGDFSSLSKVTKTYPADKIYVVTESGLAIPKSTTANLSAPESWNSYDFSSTTLPVTEINDIIEYNSEILLATNDGIYRNNGSVWEQYLLDGTEVTSMKVYGSSLYVITYSSNTYSILSYNGSSFTTLYSTSADLNDLYIYDSSNIFAATSGGMVKISGSSTETIAPDGPEDNLFADMAVDDDGTLWVATGTDSYGIGIMAYDGNSWTTYKTSNTSALSSNGFFTVFQASDNTMYFGSWGRAFASYADGTFTNYYSSDISITGIESDESYIVIDDISEDSDGNIWLLNYNSNAGEPLSMLDTEGNITNFSVSSSLTSDDQVAYLVVDQYNTKWFGCTKGTTGLFYFNENDTPENTSDDDVGRLTTTNGLISNTITALALDNTGTLWVGTNSGVTIIPQPNYPTSSLSSPTALKLQTVNCIAVDAINQKWIGTTDGVIVMDSEGSEVVEQYTSSNSPLPSDDITCITMDDNTGIVYIGTELGMVALETDAVEALDTFNDELFIYPNPVVIEGSDPTITIDGLVEDAGIKIISISGKLVKEITTEGGRIATWNGRDKSGKYVASGIYIIVAYDEDGSSVSKGKVAIIRK